MTIHSEVLHGTVPSRRRRPEDGNRLGDSADPSAGHVFYFEYGVAVFWGLTPDELTNITDRVIRGNETDPLPLTEQERDELNYVCTCIEASSCVKNDTIILSDNHGRDEMVRISIAHALAQSVKLSVYEEQVAQLARKTKNLPEQLAQTGKVDMSNEEVSMLLGELFLLRSRVNLVSTVLDTPDFFWHAPQNLQRMYSQVRDYVDLCHRTEILNSRCDVVAALLSILREQQYHNHSSKLEWIIIWLIVAEFLVGLGELASLIQGAHTS